MKLGIPLRMLHGSSRRRVQSKCCPFPVMGLMEMATSGTARTVLGAYGDGASAIYKNHQSPLPHLRTSETSPPRSLSPSSLRALRALQASALPEPLRSRALRVSALPRAPLRSPRPPSSSLQVFFSVFFYSTSSEFTGEMESNEENSDGRFSFCRSDRK